MMVRGRRRVYTWSHKKRGAHAALRRQQGVFPNDMETRMNAPLDKQLALQPEAITLDDKYTLERGRVFLTCLCTCNKG